jgi:hypothetical protein
VPTDQAISRGERELAQLLRRVDASVSASSRMSEWEVVDAIAQAWDLWGQLPDDLQGQISDLVRTMWQVRGAMYYQVVQWVIGAVRTRGLSVPAAVRQAGLRFNLRPRSVAGARPGMSPVQVRQYHRRQQARGRRPGSNPAMRGRRLREMEWMYEAGATHRPNPEVLRICRLASARAQQIREARRRGCSPNELQRLRGQANYFVRRWANQMIGKLGQLHPNDIDGLVGCLARVEHAAGATLPALGPLRSAAMRRR